MRGGFFCAQGPGGLGRTVLQFLPVARALLGTENPLAAKKIFCTPVMTVGYEKEKSTCDKIQNIEPVTVDNENEVQLQGRYEIWHPATPGQTGP